MDESERLVRVKVNGQFKLDDLNWAVYERRSSKVDGPKVDGPADETERSFQHKLDSPKIL